VKILITGFRHSGTTMTRLLVQAHPQVGWIFDEESYIELDKPKEFIEAMASKRVDIAKQSWGEKIPWGTRPNDLKAERAIAFSKKWLKFFRGKARVLHVLRHPLDVALSGTYSMGIAGQESLNFMDSSLPKFIEFINSDNRCATVLYEDILLDTYRTLAEMFKFLNLKHDPKTIYKVQYTKIKFGGINPSRAYAHRVNSSTNLQIDYQKIVDSLQHRI
jgi:hypothetical protein